MENSKAVIVEHNEKPSNLCLAAARISTNKGSALEVYNESMEKKDTSLVEKVIKMGHHSVSEHAYFTVVFDNVSVIVEQFIIEFRLASFTVKSRRYVDYKKMGWVVPGFRFKDDVLKDEQNDLLEKYNKGVKSLFLAYSELTDLDIPREDARFILPYGFRSNFYCTLNARELMKVIYSACYGRGSKYPEIKKLGNMLLEQAQAIFKEPFSMIEQIASFKDEIPAGIRNLLKDKINNDYLPDESPKLISSTKDASKNVVISQIIAETGISTKEAQDLIENDEKLYKDILNLIIHDGRARALESAVFGFRINRITLASLTHLVRHRMQSIIIPELSYGVRFNDFIMPQTILENEKSLKIYQKAYEAHMELYKLFKDKLLCSEDLSYFALAGMRLDVVTSMNARELFHFFRLRTCMRAQWEIRKIACDMLSILRTEEIDLFSSVGPGCFMDGKCPEGKFTCGQMKEVGEFISKL